MTGFFRRKELVAQEGIYRAMREVVQKILNVSGGAIPGETVGGIVYGVPYRAVYEPVNNAIYEAVGDSMDRACMISRIYER